MSEGKRYDEGKLRYGLIPTDSMREVTKVFTMGAKKYADRNWEKGMAWSRTYEAMQRHLQAWWSGESRDPESGYSHMAHAVVNGLFLIAYELRDIGTDDRENLHKRDPRALINPEPEVDKLSEMFKKKRKEEESSRVYFCIDCGLRLLHKYATCENVPHAKMADVNSPPKICDRCTRLYTGRHCLHCFSVT